MLSHVSIMRMSFGFIRIEWTSRHGGLMQVLIDIAAVFGSAQRNTSCLGQLRAIAGRTFAGEFGYTGWTLDGHFMDI